MDPSQILKARGIEDEARWAGWEDAPDPLHGRTPGWLFPVFWSDGSVCTTVQRWKAADSAHTPKYLWDPSQVDDRPRYYMLPGLAEAIQEANGELHMVSGEPDLLTMNSAGFANALSVLDGEKAIPDSFATDLDHLGVTRVIYWRDRDQTGLEAAQKIRDRLAPTAIAFECRLLASAEDDKYDLNRLWIDCRFDPGVFIQVLGASVVEDVPATPVQAPLPSPSRPPDGEWQQIYEAWCEDVELEAVRLWGISAPGKGGYSRMFKCPFHDDKTPSAHWNYQTHGIQCFGACGKLYTTHEVAERLGYEPWEDRKAHQRPVRAPAQGNGRRRKRKSILIPHDVAAQEALDRLTGDKIPDVEPFLCPYKPLRLFGGLARFHEPGQVALIISGSGMGKSSLVERMLDNLSQEGMDAVMWGPEWSEVRYQNRRVARYGGPLVEPQFEHERHVWEMARQGKKVTAKPLTKADFKRARQILEGLKKWPGKTHYIDRKYSLSKALRLAGEDVEDLRVDGRQVRMAVFDYAQLEISPGKGWAELELLLSAVQEWSIEHNIFSVVISQVNKGEANKLQQSGTLFTADSAQLLSDQRTKLVITLNPLYIDGERHEKAWIYVVKNSIGAYPARILVKTALHRHDWTDTVLKGIGDEPLTDQSQTALQPSDEDDDAPPVELSLDWFMK